MAGVVVVILSPRQERDERWLRSAGRRLRATERGPIHVHVQTGTSRVLCLSALGVACPYAVHAAFLPPRHRRRRPARRFRPT